MRGGAHVSLLAMLLVTSATASAQVATPGDGALARSTSPSIGGVAVGMHFMQPRASYESYLWEIAHVGADTVSLVVSWHQRDIRSVAISPDPEATPSDASVSRAIDDAHRLGLRVLLFPIVALDVRAAGEWRGKLAPTDRDAWYASYSAFLDHYLDVASAHGVEFFSVGSELGTMQLDTERWRGMIAHVRSRYSGRLIYSANWDNYANVGFWPELDYLGVTGYYELASSAAAVPEQAELVAAWRPVVAQLRAVAQQAHRPLVITELGYVSQTAAARYPWDYTRTGGTNLVAQQRLYAAFAAAWGQVPELGGVFFWNWFGGGGGLDNGYSPRGKPAEGVIREWFLHREHTGP